MTTKTSTLSEPKPVKLKSYEFNPEDLNNLVSQYSGIDPSQDLKSAKKARTAVKAKIAEVKRVHAANKKIIKDFQGELVAYDLQKFQTLTKELTELHDKLNQSILSIENSAAAREKEISSNMKDITLDISNKIMDAKSDEDIQLVQAEISSLEITPALFDAMCGPMEEVRTSLLMKAANRALEISNAGGIISSHHVDPIKMQPSMVSNFESGQKYSDAELLNAMEIMSIPGKGWVAMTGSNGFALYQVDDANAPKSVRMALQIALEEHKAKTV